VDIYLPAAYDTCTQPLPVLYLLHGINGYEGSWQDKGNAMDTLEALIASGRCQPMILVMPDCNKWPFKKRPTDRGNIWKCILHYNRLRHEHKIEYALSDLMDMIDSLYCVSDCAVAGLSDGARMSANLANLRSDCIHQIGLFSPVLNKNQLPKDSTQTVYIYVGTKDIFQFSGKRYRKRMQKLGYPHRYIEFQYNHNWYMWRDCLSDFLERISQSQ